LRRQRCGVQRAKDGPSGEQRSRRRKSRGRRRRQRVRGHGLPGARGAGRVPQARPALRPVRVRPVLPPPRRLNPVTRPTEAGRLGDRRGCGPALSSTAGGYADRQANPTSGRKPQESVVRYAADRRVPQRSGLTHSPFHPFETATSKEFALTLTNPPADQAGPADLHTHVRQPWAGKTKATTYATPPGEKASWMPA